VLSPSAAAPRICSRETVNAATRTERFLPEERELHQEKEFETHLTEESSKRSYPKREVFIDDLLV
jgi:hypothetical protein